MTNADLAQRCIAIADEHLADRKAALCAAVALGTTTSLTGARKALREWNGPTGIRDGAVTLLDHLAATEPETAP